MAEADNVVSHIVARGVHTGDLLGIPPNKEVETKGIAIGNRRCARVLQQLGALPGPPT